MPFEEYLPVSKLAEPRMTVSPSTLALAAPAARRPAVAPAIARPERVRARIALRAPAGSRTWVIWYLPHDPADVPPSSFLRLSRSEEHTSELQSLMRISYAVFCLKKKKITNTHQE